jgi:hypothetical protein
MSEPSDTTKSIKEHLSVIFGRLPKTGYVCVRGIGEKGTDGEGTFRDDKFIDLSLNNGDMDSLVGEVSRHVARWNEHGRASFIVPAILSQPKGSSENVEEFRSLVVDLDAGDIDGKQAFLEKHIGVPTAVVLSGGEIDGMRKRHLYWSLNHPCRDIEEVVMLRDELARKGGGDMQFGLGVDSNRFGRAHQPVRIAGSTHNKNNVKTPVSIDLKRDASVYGLQLLKDRIMLSGMHDGSPVGLRSDDIFKPERAAVDLTEKVYEGGEGEKNRWSQFSRVCGHYMRVARRGDISIEEAKDGVLGWVETSMVPPWPVQRSEREWNALLQRDMANHGPFPEPIKPMVEGGEGLEVWAAHRWSMSEKPKRKFIVENLILSAKHQLLVAEGGAGKTFLMLDLAIKVSSFEPGDNLEWCGSKIKEGGTVVILTTEDDKDELHIRLHDIDPENRRERAGDKLIILPTINSGGAFSIVETDRATGEARASRRWAEFMALLRRLPDLKLVVVDTLNSTLHGEENSATVINEFVRVASQVCGELGAALMLTHHIRKQGDEPIKSVDDMKASIRGSSALPSAFRSVIGIWHCPDYDRRLTGLGLTPKRGLLWKMAVIKANNPEMLQTERTLLRGDVGLLMDVTAQDQFSVINIGERHAWLALAIERAANELHPFSIEGKNAKSGLYKRRNELPHVLRNIGPGEFLHIVDELLQRKVIVAASAKGGKDKKWLDVPTGPIATDEEGATLASGAYHHPNWDDWVYDKAINICTPKYK